MRLVPFAFACLLLPGLATFCPADEPPGKDESEKGKKVSTEEVQRLVKQLGHDKFVKRMEAKKQLEAIGDPASDLLKKAVESSDDAEVRGAARAILAVIAQQNSGLLRIFAGHGNRVNGVAIRADGKRALSASWDGALRYWNLENGELLKEMRGHQGQLNSVALSADGKRALTGGNDGTMRLWDLQAGKEIHTFVGHPSGVWDVVFSPDGKKALSGCGDGTARLWDLDSGKMLLALGNHKGGTAWTVAFTPDGKRGVTGGGSGFLANGTTQGSLVLWDLTTGKEILQFQGHTKDVRRVAVSRDGKQLLSGSFDGTMRLWDLETGSEIQRFDGPGNFVESVAFTRDGKKALCSYGPRNAAVVYAADPTCSLSLWDLASGKEIKQFKGHTGPVLSLAISGDGRFIVSGSADNTMRLWKLSR